MGFYSQKFFEPIYNFAKHIYVFGNCIQFFFFLFIYFRMGITD